MEIAGVILAGGKGERLGGADKMHLLVGGRSLLEHQLDCMSMDLPHVVVSVGAPMASNTVLRPKITYCEDHPSAPPGPVAGLFSVIQALAQNTSPTLNASAEVEFLFSVAIDSPCLPPNLAETLVDHMRPGVDVVMAAYSGQIYPTNAVWRVSALIEGFQNLSESQKGIGLRSLVPPKRICKVDFEDICAQNPFRNINTVADIAYFAQRF